MIDMVKLVSFDVDAGHLMERLLESAGIGEVGPMTVKVQPEADGALLGLLIEAAEGRWVIRVLDREGGPEWDGDDLRLDRVTADGVWGEEIDEQGRPAGTSVFRGWGTVGQLHIY